MKSMKKIEFRSVSHLVMFVMAALMTLVSIVVMFFNLAYILFAPMSALLTLAVYKERNW